MTPTLRPLTRAEIDPYIELLRSEGFTPEVERGVWLGAFVGERLAGWLRVFELDGISMIEDVYVLLQDRESGVATALLSKAREGRDELWLICDDEMIGFYEARGYALMPKDAFPGSLATLYTAKGEWPDGGDHDHNALRWGNG